MSSRSMAEKAKPTKTCFVVGPIGGPNTPIRNAADWLLKGIIKPVLEAEEFGYSVTRADEIADPGEITDQIIDAVLNSDLVIGDLTGHNPNAFYELCIRHMVEGKVIHVMARGEKPPFDVQNTRIIFFGLEHPDDVERAKKDLADQVRATERPDFKVSNPITRARGVQKLRESGDTGDQLMRQMMDQLQSLQRRVEELSNRPKPGPFYEYITDDDGVVRPALPASSPPAGSLSSLAEALLKFYPPPPKPTPAKSPQPTGPSTLPKKK
jgi:hypothetical protein